jgi:predicted Zn-dependent protease
LQRTTEALAAEQRAHQIERIHRNLADLMERVTREPGNIALRRDVAANLLELGQLEEAVKWLQIALRMNPNDVATQQALAKARQRLDSRPRLASQAK